MVNQGEKKELENTPTTQELSDEKETETGPIVPQSHLPSRAGMLRLVPIRFLSEEFARLLTAAHQLPQAVRTSSIPVRSSCPLAAP